MIDKFKSLVRFCHCPLIYEILVFLLFINYAHLSSNAAAIEDPLLISPQISGNKSVSNSSLEIATCKPELGRFLCRSENECIEGIKVCNREPDCADGSDEFENCEKSCENVKCAHLCMPHVEVGKRGRCYCKPGYSISGPNSDKCTNVDECSIWDSCSQGCEDLEGSFKCSCLPQFHLADNNRSCTPNDPDIVLVYALKNSIRKINVGTKSKKSLSVVENKGQTIGVSVDYHGGWVLWTDVDLGKEAVYRRNIEGDGPVETVIDTGLLLPEGIAFDWITGNIYIAESNKSQIIVCTNDGKFCTVLVQELVDKPREISLHPATGLMFWTDWGSRGLILRSSMDGTSPLPLVSTDIRWPNCLSVDHGRERLFWMDAFLDRVESIGLGGEDRVVLASPPIHHPFSLEVFGDHLYWSDWYLNSIVRCNKLDCKGDNTEVVKNVGTGSIPNGISIFHEASQPLSIRSNSCKGKCSHLCVLSGSSGFSCVCPAGYILDSSKRKCIDDETSGKLLIGSDSSLRTLRFNSIGRDVIEDRNLTDLKGIGALEYNSVNGTLFISDLFWKTIYEMNMTTGGLRTIANRHLDSVKSLALDPIGQNLYWADSTKRKIEVMSLRTKSRAVIAMEAEHPQSILLIPQERVLLVAVTGRRGGRILRLSMNGYNRKTLIRMTRGEPIALAYNYETQRVYWVDGSRDMIEHISLDGKSQGTAVRNSGTPYSLTSFQNKIYWTDRHTQYLHTMVVLGGERGEGSIFVGSASDRNTSGVIESFINGNFLAKITVISKGPSYANLSRSHECGSKKNKCSHICLLSGEGQVGTCVCPEGMILEKNTTCTWPHICLKSQFQCKNDKKCIDSDWVCDGFNDCEFGEDEVNCTTVSICRESDFKCSSDNSCIPLKWKCDGERDCEGGEDELGCEAKVCTAESDFRCNNGRCIPRSWACDHQFDCPSGEDESGCAHKCTVGTFKCEKDKTCIQTDWVCDGDPDCSDGSDEHEHCDKSCGRESFRCLSHHCIPLFLACNGVNDCDDNSDELDCNSTSWTSTLPPLESEFNVGLLGNELFEVCAWDQYSCFTGECVPLLNVCNNVTECPDGSDEGGLCGSSCKDNGECPHRCTPTPLGSKCVCHPGYESDPKNKRACIDINECTAGRPCEHTCINTKGSFKCECHEGYALRSDNRRCKPLTKLTKPHFINPADRVEKERMEGDSLMSSQESSGSSAGWWVFSIFLILVLIGAIGGFVLWKKKIHPKNLFQQYSRNILVKFNSRSRGNGAQFENVYDEVCDGPSSAPSSTLTNKNNGKNGPKSNSMDSGILTVLENEGGGGGEYEELDDHFITYSQHSSLLDREFM